MKTSFICAMLALTMSIAQASEPDGVWVFDTHQCTDISQSGLQSKPLHDIDMRATIMGSKLMLDMSMVSEGEECTVSLNADIAVENGIVRTMNEKISGCGLDFSTGQDGISDFKLEGEKLIIAYEGRSDLCPKGEQEIVRLKRAL